MLERLQSVNTSDMRVEKAGKTTTARSAEELRKKTACFPRERLDICDFDSEKEICIHYDGATYTSNAKLVEHLKSEQHNLHARFLQTVKNTILKQSGAVSDDEIWHIIARGEYEVDAETQKAAQDSISEDGYWGVKETSLRIVSFAKALVGGDIAMLDEMKDAFIKGYEAVAKVWGGDLPEIAQKTYDAVMDLFEEWEQENTGEVVS